MVDLTPVVASGSLALSAAAAYFSSRTYLRLKRQDRAVTWRIERVGTGESFALRNEGPGSAYDVTVDMPAATVLSSVPQRGVTVAAGAAIQLGTLAPRSSHTAWPEIRVEFCRTNWRGRPGPREVFKSVIT